jgi:hypothetical protein
MNKLRLKRRRAAWLLLAVFLPMLLLSSLHWHGLAEVVGDECEACVNHISHSGHLSPTSLQFHDCVVCHYASLTFTAATVIVALVFSVKLFTITPRQCSFTLRSAAGLILGRAPPCCF